MAERKGADKRAGRGGAVPAEALDRVRAALGRAQQGGEENAADALSDLGAIPAPLAAAALAMVARESGVAALPLLVTAAERGPQQLALAAIDALGSLRAPDAALVLQRLADGAVSKELRKAAKGSLFRLQTAGVAPATTAETQLAAGQHLVLLAKVSNPDGKGDRFLALAVAGALGAVDLLAAVVSDRTGIVDFRGLRVSRNELAHRVSQLLPAGESLRLVDAPPDYVRQALWQAHERNRLIGHPVPDEYYRWAGSIGTVGQTFEREPVYDSIDAAVIRWNPQILEESGQLFHEPEFATWLIPPEEAEQAVRNRTRARQAGLILPGQAEESQGMRLVDHLAEGFFDKERRLLYKRRLEQTAYVLLTSGRLLDARRAVAAAMALDPDSRTPIARQPFPLEMALHTVDVLEVESERQRARGGGLILPG